MDLFRRSPLFQIDRRDLWIAFFAIVATIAFIPVFTYLYFARDLTTKEGIMNRNDTGFTLLDRNEQPFFTFYQAKQKEFIPLSDIPEFTKLALISMEDRDFYSHPGFSIRGIGRSVLSALTQREIVSGGSTITQQLVKNGLLNPDRSFLRKYQEIVLAQEIERRYTKNEILEMYFNSVYFGEGAFGIEEAASRYFDKHAKDLSLAESAMLIGVLPSPSSFSPISGSIESAKNRQELVLNAMAEEGYITQAQKTDTLKEKLTLNPNKSDLNSTAPHFALMVKKQLIDRYGEEQVSRSGFTVKTTIDLKLQQYAEEVVEKQVINLEYNKVSNGAAIVLNPKNGEILSYVGSKNWYDEKDGKFDIVSALRQPGSAFKPIVYTAAMEKRIITPATILKDEPVTYRTDQYSPEYKPQNYDRKFRGPVTARRALANSLNVPAVEVESKLGVPATIDFAKKTGITTINDPKNYGLSIVLGAAEVKLLEITSAYSVFANGGVRNAPVAILEIEDKRKKVIYTTQPKPEKIIEPEFAFLISSILSDNRARSEAFGNALTISRTAAVKTGTTENYKDAWTIGYTPSLVVGVWVGNNDATPMDNIAGSLGAAPIWRSLMERFLQGSPIESFKPPAGIVTKSVCGFFNKDASSSAITEYFARGTEPKTFCNIILPTATPSATLAPSNPPPTSNPPTPTPQNQGNKNNENGEKKDKDITPTVIPSLLIPTP